MDNIGEVEQVVVAVKLGTPENQIKLVQSTKGVREEDLDYILDMAARVDLLDGQYRRDNLFSVVAPSRLSIIGRLTPRTSDEKSSISEAFYLECLIVDFQTFYRCGANPMTLISCAMSSGKFSLYKPGRILCSFELPEREGEVKEQDLRRITEKSGKRALIVLLDSIINNTHTFFVTSEVPAYRLVTALYSLFPVYSRRSLTFSVDVCFRGDTSFRFVGVTRNKTERVFDYFDVFLDLRDIKRNREEYLVTNSWSSAIEKFDVLEFNSFFALYYLAIISNRELCEKNALAGEEPYLDLNDLDWVGRDFRDFIMHIDEAENAEIEECFDEGEDWKNFADFEALNSDDSWKGSWTDRSRDSEAPISFSDEINRFVNDLEYRDLLSKKSGSVKASNGDDEADDNELANELDKTFDDINEELRALGVKFSDEFVAKQNCLSLSPFAILSAEYPNYNVELRKLDCILKDVCVGRGNDAVEMLEEMWKGLLKEWNPDVLERIRGAYIKWLEDASEHVLEWDAEDAVISSIGQLEVLRILSIISSENK